MILNNKRMSLFEIYMNEFIANEKVPFQNRANI